jgi:hypothetical protein
MLNQIVAGVSAASLAFCMYSAGWGGCSEGRMTAAAGGEDCCTVAVSTPVGSDVCTHCEEEAKHSAEQSVMFMDVAATAPATKPAAKGTDVGNTKCLISGEAIGSMGEGETVEYKGKVYHFCCSDCVATFKKDSDKYVMAFEADPAKWGAPKK